MQARATRDKKGAHRNAQSAQQRAPRHSATQTQTRTHSLSQSVGRSQRAKTEDRVQLALSKGPLRVERPRVVASVVGGSDDRRAQRVERVRAIDRRRDTEREKERNGLLCGAHTATGPTRTRAASFELRATAPKAARAERNSQVSRGLARANSANRVAQLTKPTAALTPPQRRRAQNPTAI